MDFVIQHTTPLANVDALNAALKGELGAICAGLSINGATTTVVFTTEPTAAQKARATEIVQAGALTLTRAGNVVTCEGIDGTHFKRWVRGAFGVAEAESLLDADTATLRLYLPSGTYDIEINELVMPYRIGHLEYTVP